MNKIEIVDQFDQGELRLAKCDKNGKRVNKKEKYHYFIILTKDKYNRYSDEILGVPLTSNKKSTFTINYGDELLNEQIDGSFNFPMQTFILCDRPCRLNKEDLFPRHEEKPKIIENKFRSVCSKICTFIVHSEKLNKHVRV